MDNIIAISYLVDKVVFFFGDGRVIAHYYDPSFDPEIVLEPD